MTEIQDLDVMVPEPKRVKFGGIEYDLPPDLPMEIFLRMNKAGSIRTESGDVDPVAQIDALTDTLSELFIWQMEETGVDAETRAQVKEQVRSTLMRRGTKFVFTLIREVYKADDEAAEESAADPTEPPVQQVAV